MRPKSLGPAARAAGLLIAALLAGPPANAGADSPAPFALERIGTPRSALSGASPAECADVCVLASPSGEVLPGVTVFRADLRFAGGALDQVEVVFDEARYEAAIAELQKRFGPGEDRHYRARAGMGAAELIAGVMVWRRDDLVIVAEQFAGKIDRSRLRFGTPRAMREMLDDIAARPVGARRDF